ncbi:glycosyltransferase family 4 protein [Liquorilactobacillus nagelii]|uniref:glycosyltransferase family 4 protein n=1 Tax=Liquorilactobacillus nagelii TaxID=82688 RepID=UPI0039ED9451
MKVLVITHVNDLSGANKSLLAIIDQLRDEITFEVLVNKKNGELSKYLKSKKIKTFYKRYHWWYAKSRISFLKKIFRYLVDFSKYHLFKYVSAKDVNFFRNRNYDLIYTNTSTVDIGSILSSKLQLPHVWHVREFGKEDFGFIKVCSKKYYKKKFLDASKVIAISNAVKKKYLLYVPNNRIDVVYNGFEISKLTSKIKKTDKIKKILVVGQVCEAKCQDQAIKACNLLVEEGYSFELHLAGVVDYSFLRKRIPNYKDLDWLFLEGQVENVYKLRDKMDVELVCSRNEAFGRVTIEAMLHGLPVIASNKGGNKELIENGKNGLLYNFGNFKELSEKIKLLDNNPKFCSVIRENGQNSAKKFTIEKTSKGVFDLFKEVTNS